LKNINLSISPKENVAIVGKSGSGKSTLSKLILNIYEPKKGKITINNIEINKYNQTSFHGKIVGQGNNNELLGKNEVYDRLFKEQYKLCVRTNYI
jgi:ABC-type multidrug transport system fused ATPase/permease subunit